jgi:hypothetical protein
LAAYRATIVNVHGDRPAVFSVADPIGAHDGWLAEQGTSRAVVITAWNPFSQAQSLELNEADNADLLSAIEQAQLKWAYARGCGPSEEWCEDGYCVFDAPDALVEEWLVRFQQNAAFRVRFSGPVEIVWHEQFRRT